LGSWLLEQDNLRWKVSFTSAYVSLGLMALTLILGPRNVLLARPNPVSTDLRRDVGIWAGIVGLLHVVVGLQVHLRGKMWLYFLFAPDEGHRLPFRYDLFGMANYTGLAAGLVLILLLALSNDLSLRSLGTSRWKALQRWNYAGAILVVLHSLFYQVIEKRINMPAWLALFGVCVVVTVALQLAALRRFGSTPGK